MDGSLGKRGGEIMWEGSIDTLWEEVWGLYLWP